MRCIVHPVKHLEGNVTLPGDKSLSHRAVLFAALANGVSRIANFLFAGVTRPMLEGLTKLGVEWECENSEVIIIGKGFEGWQSAKEIIHCGNSATTLRLLAGAMAATNAGGVLDGSEGLRRRPMERIVVPLQKAGVNIQATDGHAPIALQSGKIPLKGLTHDLSVASAQVKTCLILAGLRGDSETMIREPGPSRDHTERMLSSMGASIRSDVEEYQGNKHYVTCVAPLNASLNPLEITLPGDISSAAFFIVAGLIVPHARLVIRNVGVNPTRTGLLDVLRKMGANLELVNATEQGGEPAGDIQVRDSHLSGTTVEGEVVVRMIDEFPILGVAAAYADGDLLVRQAEELRYKESDRISMLCHELLKLGVNVTERADGFIIKGNGRLRGGEVDAHGDHRLALALMTAGLGAESPVVVNGAEVIAESLPDFIPILQSLGAEIECGE